MARYDLSPSVPAIVEDIRTGKAAHDVHYEAQPPENVVGLAEVVAHLLMAGVIFFAMWRSVADVRNALIVAVLYFGLATTLRILAKTDTLKDWLRAWLDYRLEKHRIDALADLADRHFDLLELQEVHKAQPVAIAEGGHTPLADNYVTPHPPRVVKEAVQWAATLYDSSGYLDPRRVHGNGKVKGQVIGSRRAGGSVEAQQYLIDRKFLAMREGGAWVNHRRYPTTVELARLGTSV